MVGNRDSNPGFLRRHLLARIDRLGWRGMRIADGLIARVLRTGAAGCEPKPLTWERSPSVIDAALLHAACQVAGEP